MRSLKRDGVSGRGARAHALHREYTSKDILDLKEGKELLARICELGWRFGYQNMTSCLGQ